MSHRILVLLCCTFAFASCAGYRMGGQKPSHLTQVKNIHVPLFENDTLQVRASSHTTNAAVDALVRDGTYRLSNANKAEAILRGRITSIDYDLVRSSRRDSLRPEELEMEITIEWSLVDADNPTRVLESGKSRGKTRFFAGGNLQNARSNAIPDAAKRACDSMISRIADGF